MRTFFGVMPLSFFLTHIADKFGYPVWGQILFAVFGCCAIVIAVWAWTDD